MKDCTHANSYQSYHSKLNSSNIRAYQNYFLELSNTYPVLSAAGSTENVGANKDALLTYRKLQYYNLFERNK